MAKELKFTDNLKQCISNGNTKPKYVEVFLVNGIKLTGTLTYVSDKLIVVGSKDRGFSNVNPIHIASYSIEPAQNRKTHNR